MIVQIISNLAGTSTWAQTAPASQKGFACLLPTLAPEPEKGLDLNFKKTSSSARVVENLSRRFKPPNVPNPGSYTQILNPKPYKRLIIPKHPKTATPGARPIKITALSRGSAPSYEPSWQA